MDYLPVFLDLRGRRCLVVGGGAVAERKIETLLRAGARVEVVAPEVNDALAALEKGGAIRVIAREFVAQDVNGAVFIIAATAHRATNQAISVAANKAGVYVNVVDQPQDSSAIMPSIVDRSPVVIAIGTGGSAPVLARMLRAKIESMIPPSYGDLARLLGTLRERVKKAVPEQAKRRRFWESVLDGPIAELLLVGRRDQALAKIEDLLTRPDKSAPLRGEVYLIGTGPGDPDLLTFRALRLMQHADVIVHDRLVSDAILDLCRRDAQRIYVGKAKAEHAMEQADINSLLLQQARNGKRVARLKGGDPFIFGRGGEEIGELAAAGVDFQVVPGITAALGCAAYAGIPLTHRDYAQSCVFVTGHQKDGQVRLNWNALVQPFQTVVVYMGLSSLGELCSQLIAHGLAPTTPAAAIERATTGAQRVVTDDVVSLASAVAAAAYTGPATIIIGDVVRLRDQLQWFERNGAP